MPSKVNKKIFVQAVFHYSDIRKNLDTGKYYLVSPQNDNSFVLWVELSIATRLLFFGAAFLVGLLVFILRYWHGKIDWIVLAALCLFLYFSIRYFRAARLTWNLTKSGKFNKRFPSAPEV